MQEGQTNDAVGKNGARSILGCAIKSMLVSVVAIASGIFYLGRWETLNGAMRAAAILLIIVGALCLVPMLVVLLLQIGKYYLRKKLVEPMKGVLTSGQEMVENNRQIFVEQHAYRPATDADFIDRDRAWYDATKQDLESAGFRWLADTVNETIERSTGLVVVVRRFISADNTTMAAIYHYVRGADLRICDDESELSDGSFVTTSNAEMAKHVTMPPQIRSEKYPADTTPIELLRLHEEAKGRALAESPGATFVEIRTVEEYEAAQDRQQAIKAAFRKGIGYLDPAEVRKIAEQKFPNDPSTAAVAQVSASLAQKKARMDDAAHDADGSS